MVTQTFKILGSSNLKLSKTKVYGVEKRESGSLSQDDASLYYYDSDTSHYYPLKEGVDYSKSVTSVSSKKGRVTFTALGAWSGSKKANFTLNTSAKKQFSDPSNVTVSPSTSPEIRISLLETQPHRHLQDLQKLLFKFQTSHL